MAVLEQLQKLEPNLKVLFVGSGNELEKKILQSSGFEYVAIPSGKFRRYGRGLVREVLDIKTTSQNIKDATRVVRGIRQARKILNGFKPDVVFTKGGYVGLPVGLAAAKLGYPLVIHESDSIFGKANQVLATKATKIAVSFPVETYQLPDRVDRSKLIYTGNPIRGSILSASPAAAEKFFPFDKNKPVVLITGSSQGAQAINQVIFSSLENLCKHYNIIHLTGERDIERARFMHHKLPAGLKTSYLPFGFLQSEMGLAYQRAEVVVARGSMSTLTEVAAVGRPAIIIPLPSSADQPSNARILARFGAIRLLEQADLTELRLRSEIDQILEHPEATNYLIKTFHKFYKAYASEHVATILHKCATKTGVEN